METNTNWNKLNNYCEKVIVVAGCALITILATGIVMFFAKILIVFFKALFL